MQWTESIVVDCPRDRVRAVIGDQREVLRWSTPPSEPGTTVEIEGDGVSVGSALVHRGADGIEKGRQELTEVTADGVRYRLTTDGPAGRALTASGVFRVEPRGQGRTEVFVDFDVEIALPFPLRRLAEKAIRGIGRTQHAADLKRLRTYLETSS